MDVILDIGPLGGLLIPQIATMNLVNERLQMVGDILFFGGLVDVGVFVVSVEIVAQSVELVPILVE